ncbi:TPA: hypothetical protein N0F65_002421 [Lagenidium giganteum]|uniref:RCC1-like domain-containing protein n=1 Tax=Lagenidium giganteum TaxID=4803 RepID=A0AAV2YN81_9STRA|nr:TPA: hypothetical protein N0F65_002421 [Lagenidium giganteum]
MNTLERIAEQRAARMLELLQADLRAQIRREHDAEPKRTTAVKEMQARIALLSDPAERERIWKTIELPHHDALPVHALPKTREFWSDVDITRFTKRQLDAAVALLDLPTGGKKGELLARLHDWINEPAILVRRAEQERLDEEREAQLIVGRVFAFGSNFHGELGLGHRQAQTVPVEVMALRAQRIVRVVSGYDANVTFAFAEDGRVFTWGGGGRAPFLATAVSKDGDTPSKQSTGETFLFPTEVRLNLWASPPAPQQPDQQQEQEQRQPQEPQQPQPQPPQVIEVACGRTDGHIAFLTKTGECFTWGRGEYGELGNGGDGGGSMVSDGRRPLQVMTLKSSPVAHVGVGNCHTAAVLADGRVFVWGGCWSGQLGLGMARRAGITDKRLQLCFPSPTVVETLLPHKVARVSCGAVHTAVVTRNGQLYTFGCGDGGRLGLGNNTDAYQPELVTALANDVVLDVSCSSWHSLCIARPRHKDHSKGQSSNEKDAGDGGYVYAFGNGLQGQLGLGKQKMAALPTRIPLLATRHVRCRAVAVSSHHSCALTTDGKLFTWGDNASGCLGRKAIDGALDSNEPELLTSITAWGAGPIISVAAGHGFTIIATGPWPKREAQRHHVQLQSLNAHVKFDSIQPLKQPSYTRDSTTTR